MRKNVCKNSIAEVRQDAFRRTGDQQKIDKMSCSAFALRPGFLAIVRDLDHAENVQLARLRPA
jgi:hypothetical protein